MITIVKQTDKEKIKMYMSLPKIKLAEMLLECNKVIDRLTPSSPSWFKVSPPTSTSSNDGYTYEATITSTASYPKNESKSTKTRKKSMGKQKRGNGKLGGKKR